MPATKNLIGTEFRSVYADSNALWRVTRERGDDTWEAVIVDEPFEINGRMIPGDYAGVTAVYDGDRIRSILSSDYRLDALRKREAEFIASLKPGDVIHYDDGFGQFVRQVWDGTQCLPVALVGNWREYDLPRRDKLGEIREGYWSERVRNKIAGGINASCTYEFDPEGKVDPRELEPLSLDVPDITPEQEEQARKCALLERIADAANAGWDDPDIALTIVRGILAEGDA